MTHERQSECRGFTEIHQRGCGRPREYGRSEDRRTPVSAHSTFGRIVFYSSAYHPINVIHLGSCVTDDVALGRNVRLKCRCNSSAARAKTPKTCGRSFSSLGDFFFFFSRFITLGCSVGTLVSTLFPELGKYTG